MSYLTKSTKQQRLLTFDEQDHVMIADNKLRDGISVLICTYNGYEKLSTTYDYLSKQKLREDIEWEIILVLSHSTEEKIEAYTSLWNSYNYNNIPFTVLVEYDKGKDRAMDKGFTKVKYNCVVVCDDDNWLSDNYLQRAYEILEENPQIGLLGGKGIPVFDGSPPWWFKDYERFFAVGSQHKASGEVIPKIDDQMKFLWGAGSVINMYAYKLLLKAGFKRIITYKDYPDLARCEDLEFCLAIQLTKYKLWYDERLTFYHFIEQDKLSWEFLKKITKSGCQARAFLRAYHQLICNYIAGSYWNKYLLWWVKYWLKGNYSFIDIKNLLFVILGLNKEGDPAYLKEFIFLNEFYGLFRYMSVQNKIYNKLKYLKRNISK